MESPRSTVPAMVLTSDTALRGERIGFELNEPHHETGLVRASGYLISWDGIRGAFIRSTADRNVQIRIPASNIKRAFSWDR